ncbi:TPA: hypothetical protein ACN4HR_001354 [Staphylococcus aureus]
MIKKLDNLDYESIEKISNIWLNSNLEAHDFIKHEYMSGSQIIIKTLDLNCDFTIIKKQLNGIVNDIFLLK